MVRTGRGLVAAAVGVVAGGLPVVVVIGTMASVAFLGGPDSPFFMVMLAALLAAAAGVGLLVAGVLALFDATRVLGVGYVVGLLVAALTGVLGAGAVFLVAVIADAVTNG